MSHPRGIGKGQERGVDSEETGLEAIRVCMRFVVLTFRPTKFLHRSEMFSESLRFQKRLRCPSKSVNVAAVILVVS